MSSAKSIGLIAIVIMAFSSFNLWLIESWIKYMLFVFESFLIIIIYLIINNYEIELPVKYARTGTLNLALPINVLLIISALALLVAEVLHVLGGTLRLILALLVTSILPGYALLNIFGFTRYFSRLETLVLSYIVSYAFMGLLTFILLPISSGMRAPLILGSLVVLGVISTLKRAPRDIQPRNSFSRSIDILALALAISFYIVSFYLIYPSYALYPDSDISRHYASSIVLWRTPDLYITYTYLLAHLHESVFINLADSSLASTQTALATLNLMMPLAFYIMAKQHLEKIDVRLPSIATLFWTLFTNSFGGYAWLYFIYLKISSIEQTQLQLLISTADKTYNGAIYGIFGLWYVPATISFVLLMAAIFLLDNKNLSKAKYSGLFSILIAALYLTHVTEAVVFTLFLAVYGSVSKNENYRREDITKSVILGFIIVIIVYYYLSWLTQRFIMNISLLISIIGPLIAIVFSFIFNQYICAKLPSIKKISKNCRKFVVKMLISVLFVIYVIAILSYASLVNSFQTSQVDAIGFVPWFMYPLMLGINSLLTIIALYYLTEYGELYKMFAFFIAFMVFAFIAGRIVSIINLYFFDAGYWEKRFIWFIKIPLATLAPLPVIYAIDGIRKKEGMSISTKRVLSLILVGTIVLYGISTTFLNLEYWTEVANRSANLPSPTEMEAINALRQILDKDPKAWLSTVTSKSSAIATFAAPADMLGQKQLLYTAYGPEMAFLQLYRHPAYEHSYIYMHNRDQDQLSRFADRFFARYLLTLPIVFENSEVKIYNASKPSPPQPNSEAALILPLDNRLGKEDFYIAYDMLSEGFYNYTVAYDLDERIFNVKTLILAYDPPGEGILKSSYQDLFNQTLSAYSIIKGSWQIIDGELLGGEVGKYGEGIILSQVSAQNFTASFKTKPLSGNKTALNCVSLVYSWIDPRNYRIADIMFNKDGYIYVHFRTIINGVEQAIPNWPGIKTDLKWELGKEYNITVAVNGTLNQISINSKPYLSINLDNIPGRIGLRYYGFHRIAFDDFAINYDIKLNLRATEDYVNFLESGGKIIVLNTNGYNFFANSLLTLTNGTFNADKIGGLSATLNLPRQIVMQKISLKDSAASVISNYVGPDGENPYIIKRDYGEGVLFYVNIYPIADAMRKAENPSIFHFTLGELLDDLNLPKIDKNFILRADGYVKAIALSGNSKAETGSLIFPLDLTLAKTDIGTINGPITLYNVTSIRIKSDSNLIIEAENFRIEDGRDFYAVLKLNSTFTVKPSTGLLGVKAVNENGEIEINNVKELSITPKSPVSLLARTPEISANQVTFTEFYPSSSLQWSTRTYGQNLKVAGLTSFQIMLSDSYSILRNVRLGQSFTRDPPITMFDELSTVPTAIFWTLLLLPILLGTVLIYTLKSLQYNHYSRIPVVQE